MKKLIIISFLISLRIIAQSNFNSTLNKNGNLNNINTSLFSSDLSNQINKNSGLLGSNKFVFGYLPWWIYADSSYVTVLSHSDLVTHIAVFSFEVDTLGNLIDPPLWPWLDILAYTKMERPYAPRVIMTVANFDSRTIHKLLNDDTIKLHFINGVKDKLNQWAMNGVNIDFENLLAEDQGNPINSFMQQLNNSVKADQPLSEVSIAVPSVNWGKTWNFKGLSESCDYMIVMEYDFFGSWSNTTGPSAPFSGAEVKYLYDIQKSINADYKDVLNSDPAKLIMGVPYYGNYWITNSPNAYCNVDTTLTKRNWQKLLYYRDIISQQNSKEQIWDDFSQTPWLKWQSDTVWNQIWYDNDSSLALKYDFALGKNLGGIGIWALGYDNGREELWNVIKKKFVTTSVNFNNPSLHASLELYQNYPNPFNPETLIEYSIPNFGSKNSVHVQLKVFDVLGREVAVLVDEEKSSGNYQTRFNVGQISNLQFNATSGVYFYRLSAGGFILTKKMVLLR